MMACQHSSRSCRRTLEARDDSCGQEHRHKTHLTSASPIITPMPWSGAARIPLGVLAGEVAAVPPIFVAGQPSAVVSGDEPDGQKCDPKNAPSGMKNNAPVHPRQKAPEQPAEPQHSKHYRQPVKRDSAVGHPRAQPRWAGCAHVARRRQRLASGVTRTQHDDRRQEAVVPGGECQPGKEADRGGDRSRSPAPFPMMIDRSSWRRQRRVSSASRIALGDRDRGHCTKLPTNNGHRRETEQELLEKGNERVRVLAVLVSLSGAGSRLGVRREDAANLPQELVGAGRSRGRDRDLVRASGFRRAVARSGDRSRPTLLLRSSTPTRTSRCRTPKVLEARRTACAPTGRRGMFYRHQLVDHDLVVLGPLNRATKD